MSFHGSSDEGAAARLTAVARESDRRAKELLVVELPGARGVGVRVLRRSEKREERGGVVRGDLDRAGTGQAEGAWQVIKNIQISPHCRPQLSGGVSGARTAAGESRRPRAAAFIASTSPSQCDAG